MIRACVRALVVLGKCCGIYYCIQYTVTSKVLKVLIRTHTHTQNAMSHASLKSPAKQTESNNLQIKRV